MWVLIRTAIYLHIEDDVVHELTQARLHCPLELGSLHQGVDKLEDGKHQVFKTKHLQEKCQ